MNCSAEEESALYADLEYLTRPEMESVLTVVHMLAEDHREAECYVCAPAG
jgi:hypothetical protein